MPADAHRDNPLSNPDDYQHYISRLQAEKAKKATIARDRRKALMADQRAEVRPASRAGGIGLSDQVRYGRLRNWMKSYALWLVTQGRAPGMEKRVAMVEYLSKHTRVGPRHVKWLESRVDFIQYVETVTEDAMARAKEEYLGMLPLVTQVQRIALEEALKDPAKLKNVTRILEGATERFFPKKAPESNEKRVIHVHLSGKQAEALQPKALSDGSETVIPEAEIEVVDVTKQDSEVDQG